MDLSDVDVATSAREAALHVVARLTREKEQITGQWATAIRLAQDNGASLREIAAVANVSPQTVANLRDK
ncbi:MAG: helix-turn-helix domain-containing protein [Acidimicrobiia bacterium]|nr:helix-turn-helix domain-containing protein [Acidimicrobiia bacterium]